MRPIEFRPDARGVVDIKPATAAVVSDSVMRSINDAPLKHQLNEPQGEKEKDKPTEGKDAPPQFHQRRLSRRPDPRTLNGPPVGSMEDELAKLKSASSAMELSTALRRVRSAGATQRERKPDQPTSPAPAAPAEPASAPPAAKAPASDPAPPVINPVAKPRGPHKPPPVRLPYPPAANAADEAGKPAESAGPAPTGPTFSL